MRFSIIYWFISFASLLLTNSAATVIGVDYGQQNIKAMVVSPKAPLELVLTPESKRKDLSGLAIRKLSDGSDGIERLYGSAVGSVATRFPRNTLFGLKQLIGKGEDNEADIRFYLREHPGAEVVTTDRNSLAFVVDGKEYSIEELTAMNIQEIINRANALLKEKDSMNLDPVDKLAITVPDFFNQHQRKALLDIGSLTTDKLDTCLISDGLSVLINFVFKQRDFPPGKSLHYIVYDMGAGSTKASLFSVLQPLNESEPLMLEFGGYGYNDCLGGSRLTLEVASLIENKFLESHKNIRTTVLHANPNAIAKIIQSAEKAKLILSANSDAAVSIESLIDDIDFKTKITRQEFEDFIQDSVIDLIKPIEDALNTQTWDSSITIKDISGVILTGGSSRVPIVQQQLSDILGEEKILRSVNADESPVNGATIRAVKLFNAFKTKALDIVERSPFDYAVKVNNQDAESIIFSKGSTYPTQKTIEVFKTNGKFEGFTVDLYDDNKIVQTVTLTPNPTDKMLTPEVCPEGIVYNATFSLNYNRIFELEKVEAICQGATSLNDTNDEKTMSVEGESNKLKKVSHLTRSSKLQLSKEDIPLSHLTPEQKTRLREHIKELNLKDSERFELEEAKNVLEGSLYEMRGFIDSEHVQKSGPKKHLQTLAEIIPKYLDWLEDDAAGAKKVDIVSKISKINALRERIEVYMKASSEPLDEDQFNEMLKKADELIKNLENAKDKAHDGLEAVSKTMSQAGYDAQKEYARIALPYYISNPLSGWKENLKSLKGTVSSIKKLIKSDLIDETNREELLELKTAFDRTFNELEEKVKLFEKARDYRFRELLSWYQRAEKARKRKEDKLKKSIESERNKTSIDEDNSIEDSLSSSATPSPSSPPVSSPSYTSIIESESSSEAAPIHDEL